jgi:hypothetical protein
LISILLLLVSCHSPFTQGHIPVIRPQIEITNNTDDELIVYHVVRDSRLSEMARYRFIGKIPPGETINASPSVEAFNIVAERNIGQEIHYNITELPVNALYADTVVYNRYFMIGEFYKTNPQITIT